MNNRTNIRIFVALFIGLQIMLFGIAQPSYGRGHGGGGHVREYGGRTRVVYRHSGYRGYGYPSYYAPAYYNYGYPAYYAPAYNNYDYRGYAPYSRYGRDVAVGAAAGAMIGGLLGSAHGHRYE